MSNKDQKTLNEIFLKNSREHMFKMLDEREEIINKNLEKITQDEVAQQALEELERLEHDWGEIGKNHCKIRS